MIPNIKNTDPPFKISNRELFADLKYITPTINITKNNIEAIPTIMPITRFLVPIARFNLLNTKDNSYDSRY